MYVSIVIINKLILIKPVKKNYLNYLDFDSLLLSAVVQALPAGEIGVCSSNQHTLSISTKILIYNIDTDYRDKLLKKTEYSFVPEKTRAEKNQFTDFKNK